MENLDNGNKSTDSHSEAEHLKKALFEGLKKNDSFRSTLVDVEKHVHMFLTEINKFYFDKEFIVDGVDDSPVDVVKVKINSTGLTFDIRSNSNN